MRRATYVMSFLYAVLAIGLFRCALVSFQAHSIGYTAFFSAASMGAAMAIVHTSWFLDEYSEALTRIDQPSQRPRLTTRQDVTVQQELAAECCEQWWTTAGGPHQCTRKDQTL